MCVCFYSVCVVLCVGRDLRMGWSPIRVLLTYWRRPKFGLLYQHRMIGDDERGAVGGMIGTGNRSTRRKLAPVLLCPPQIPLDLTWPVSIYLSIHLSICLSTYISINYYIYPSIYLSKATRNTNKSTVNTNKSTVRLGYGFQINVRKHWLVGRVHWCEKVLPPCSKPRPRTLSGTNAGALSLQQSVCIWLPLSSCRPAPLLAKRNKYRFTIHYKAWGVTEWVLQRRPKIKRRQGSRVFSAWIWSTDLYGYDPLSPKNWGNR
jgi:hypothetical protein